MRHQDATQCLDTEPGAAAFIGDRQAPSADPMVAAADHRPSDAARADDEHGAIAALVRADAGGMGIGGEDRAAEGLLMQFCRGQVGRLGGAGQRQTGGDARQILR